MLRGCHTIFFTAISFEIFASLCKAGSFRAQPCTADLKSSDFINDGCTDSHRDTYELLLTSISCVGRMCRLTSFKKISLNLKTLEAVEERSAHRRLSLRGLLLVVLTRLEGGDHAAIISRAALPPLPSCWPMTSTAQFCFCFFYF